MLAALRESRWGLSSPTAPPKTANILIEDWARRGARPVEEDSAVRTGITKMHLSDEFDAVSAEAASLELSRRYMNSDAYFSLKSFSYYPRDYRRVDFDADVLASDPAVLPFRLAERSEFLAAGSTTLQQA